MITDLKDHYFVSTSDDKSLRKWEYDIGAELKYIAEPNMHAIPAVSKTRDGVFLFALNLIRRKVVALPIDGQSDSRIQYPR